MLNPHSSIPARLTAPLVAAILVGLITGCAGRELPEVRRLSEPDPPLTEVGIPAYVFAQGMPDLWIGVDVEVDGAVDAATLLQALGLHTDGGVYDISALCHHDDPQLVVPYSRGDPESDLPSVICSPSRITSGQLLLRIEERMARDLLDRGVVKLHGLTLGDSTDLRGEITFDLAVKWDEQVAP